MLAFEVEINGKRQVIAGIEDWSILALHVNGRRGNPDAAAESTRVDDLDFSVGGMSEPDESGIRHHFRWARQDIAVGSKIVVTIMETDSPDPPVKRYRSDREVQENPFTEEEIREMRWQSYLELKKEFESAQG